MNKIRAHKFVREYALAILLFLVWFLYIFVLARYELWRYVGVSHMKPLFADLHAVLSAIQCHSRGLNVFETNPCDVAGRVHVYGSLWLHLGAVGLGAAHLFTKGFLVDVAFMAISVLLVKPTSKAEFAKCCLIVLSPAVTLGVERANNDLIIFSLIATSAILITQKTRLAQVCGLFIIYMSALLKFYPSILFAAVLLSARRNTKELVLMTALSLGLAALWLATNFNELLLVKDLVPKPIDYFATGLRAMWVYVGRPYPWVLTLSPTWLLAGFMALITVGAASIACRLKAIHVQSDRSTFNYALFIFGLAILFITYTINSNYDYRWVFFIFTMPWLFDIKKSEPDNKFLSCLVNLAIICAAITMWTEALRANSIFGIFNINVFFNIGRSTFSIELFQQFLKEIAAWGLFIVLFAFAIKTFPKK